MNIPGNTSPEEFFKYHCTDENAKAFYEKAAMESEKALADIRYANSRIEALEEQLYFARELLDNLETAIDQTTRMSEFKRCFFIALEDSCFER